MRHLAVKSAICRPITTVTKPQTQLQWKERKVTTQMCNFLNSYISNVEQIIYQHLPSRLRPCISLPSVPSIRALLSPIPIPLSDKTLTYPLRPKQSQGYSHSSVPFRSSIGGTQIMLLYGC